MYKARRVLISLATAAALASAVPANAASDRSAGCASKMTFLLWPQGHPAIAAIGFADMTTPHIEVYRAGNGTYQNAQFLAWAAAGKTPEPSPSTTPACLYRRQQSRRSREQTQPAARLTRRTSTARSSPSIWSSSASARISAARRWTSFKAAAGGVRSRLEGRLLLPVPRLAVRPGRARLQEQAGAGQSEGAAVQVPERHQGS